MASHQSIREKKKHAFKRIEDLHRSGKGGYVVSLALSKSLDHILKDSYNTLPPQERKKVAVVALGGYGRREQSFHSDVDVMFLVKNSSKPDCGGEAAKILLHALLDSDLDIGHSVRSVKDCIDTASTDIEVYVSLLDARHVCGDQKLYAKLIKYLQGKKNQNEKREFIRRLSEWSEERFRKYGSSTRLLEPNIKNSAGGLRDLQTALWMSMVARKWSPSRTQKKETALPLDFINSSQIQKLIGKKSQREARKSLDFLLRIRHELHLFSSGLNDVLSFSSQPAVAKNLGYRSTKKRSNVERFMQDYYVAAKTIETVSTRIIQSIRLLFEDHKGKDTVPVDDLFQLTTSGLEFRKGQKLISNPVILKGAIKACQLGCRFSYGLREEILRQRKNIQDLRTKEECDLFRVLLQQPHNLGIVLRDLNDLGVLSIWIPEWGPMVAFFQHNVYHYFTADEHTLQTIIVLEQFGDEQNVYGEMMRGIGKRETLILASLFHDISKPHDVQGHEKRGAQVARSITKRLLFLDISEDVEFLVRHHLLMEQVAFRRDLNDPQTLTEFASHFSTPEQLDYLLLLTCADLKAVNKNVWTDWKGMLLFELYKKTRSLLEKNLSRDEMKMHLNDQSQKTQGRTVEKLLDSSSTDGSKKHLEGFDQPGYVSSFDDEEIIEHIKKIGEADVVSSIIKHHDNHTEFTIIAADAPFALSKFCGVLTANDANILNASIFTSTDGIIIDRFSVNDLIEHSRLREDQCQHIQKELDQALRGLVSVESLIERHHLKWKRRTKRVHSNIRVDVEFEDHPRYTIIDVFAPDMLGFLYKITETISTLGLIIHFAKIATRADGIVDTFYVLDDRGKRIKNATRKTEIRNELLKTIEELLKTELVVV